MNPESSDPGASAAPERRVIGRLAGARPGPSLLAFAAIHGNEPAGMRAAERVLAGLESSRAPLRGELVLLAGNLAAIRLRQRFVERDLNRAWSPERVTALRAASTATAPEDAEQLALIDAIAAAVAGARGPLHFVDMHTSSAPGPPFATVGDTLRNRAFARRFPLPLILGLEEQIDGSLTEFLGGYGFVTLGIEAGQHESPEAVARLEAALWLAVVGAGLLDAADVPDLERWRAVLAEASRGMPRVVEVRYRHPLDADDHFRMEPGFTNFRPVRIGERLARDKHGLVLAPLAGRILLPLYQGQGDDGFFIACDVRASTLGLTALLRRLRLGGLVRHLPGARRLPGQRDAVVLSPRALEFYSRELFHLAGFRRARHLDGDIVLRRRAHDVAPPRRVSFP